MKKIVAAIVGLTLRTLGLNALLIAAIPSIIAACAAAPRTDIVSPPGSTPAETRSPSAVDARSSYHFMLGYQAELAQDTERAIQEYQAALRTDPTSRFLKARLAALLFSAGDLMSALRYADEVAEGVDQDAQLLGQIAGIYAGAGQVEKALALFERAIQIDTSKSESYFSRGLLLLNLKRFDEAVQSIEQGIKIAPDSPVGYYYLGRVAIEAKQPDKAIASFERAMTVNPAFEPAYMALASAYESQQNHEKAIAVYRKYLQLVNPRGREIRQHLIRLYINGKEYKEAMAELEKVLADDPSDLDAQLRLSLIYGELKEYPKAIERLTTILAVRPAELKIRDYLGFMLEETKQYDKAVAAYTDNLKLDPNYFDSHLHLGVLLYRLKRFSDAAAHLSQAVQLNPKQPEGYLVLGLTYLQTEQYELALQTFEEGIRYNPTNPDLHFNLGTAYDKLNRFDDVVRAMETTLKLDPKHADALNYLGYSYAERGIKIEEAVALTKQAVALKPNNGYYVDSLGWAFFKMGLINEALAEIKRAVDLVGDDPVIFEHLGEIYLKKDLISEAREAWLHSLELDPSNIKLIERFRERGMGDPTQEERIRQAQRRVSENKAFQHATP